MLLGKPATSVFSHPQVSGNCACTGVGASHQRPLASATNVPRDQSGSVLPANPLLYQKKAPKIGCLKQAHIFHIFVGQNAPIRPGSALQVKMSSIAFCLVGLASTLF